MTEEKDYIPKVISSINHIAKGRRHLLLHPEKPMALKVNPTGMEIYRLCNGRNSMGIITRNIASKYQQPYNRVYKDVVSFIKRLDDLHMTVPTRENKKDKVLLPRIQGIHLNLTNQCNLRCIHCAITDGKDTREITVRRVTRLIDELANNGGKSISITGGEPLLRKDCLSILAYAASRLKTTLLTNAVSITPETARNIVNLGITVQISLDGSKPEIHDAIRGKGAFLKTMQGIELLRNAGVGERLYIRATLMKNNLKDLKDIIKLAQRLGVRKIRLATVEKIGRAKSIWKKLTLSDADYAFLFREIIRSSKKANKSEQFLQTTWGCSGLNVSPVTNCNIGRIITVDASGDIFPCTMMIHPDFCIGNIGDMNLKDVSKSKKLKTLYHTCCHRKETISQCKSCHWKNFCQGGCPASAYASTGSLTLIDTLCQMRNKFYREVFLGSE